MIRDYDVQSQIRIDGFGQILIEDDDDQTVLYLIDGLYSPLESLDLTQEDIEDLALLDVYGYTR